MLAGQARRLSSTARHAALAALVLLAPAAVRAENSATTPPLPGKVSITQKLDAQLPLQTMFRDENGRVVRLGDYFKSGKPVLLNFMYFRCPMLCPMVLDGTVSSLTELKSSIGKDFDVITVSIDPRDMPKTAAEKKTKYVRRYGRPGASAGWHFLTGPDSAIHQLTDAVGFHYAYDAKEDQFAHPTALMIVTPQGKVSRYFYGFEYPALDLRLGLMEASSGKIGNATEQVLLLCYHYDPATGKYSKSAMNFVRAGGIATVAALGGFIFVMVRSEKRGRRNPPADNDEK